MQLLRVPASELAALDAAFRCPRAADLYALERARLGPRHPDAARPKAAARGKTATMFDPSTKEAVSCSS